METELDQPTQELGALDDGTDGTVLDRLRQLRQEKAGSKPQTFDLDVPGYGGQLLVRYRFPERGYERVTKAAKLEARGQGKDREVEANADVLIACCGAVLGRDAAGAIVDPRNEAPVEADELPENPLRFDDDLALSLGIEVPVTVAKRQRFIVRSLFSIRGLANGAEGDVALITQGGRVYSWLAGVNAEQEDEAAGE